MYDKYSFHMRYFWAILHLNIQNFNGFFREMEATLVNSSNYVYSIKNHSIFKFFEYHLESRISIAFIYYLKMIFKLELLNGFSVKRKLLFFTSIFKFKLFNGFRKIETSIFSRFFREMKNSRLFLNSYCKINTYLFYYHLLRMYDR